jgi:hypothetical protein
MLALPLRYFLGAWALACVLLLLALVALWLFRIPGTTLSDFTNGPKGQHAPRVVHSFGDALRCVRPEKRRVVYALALVGASIASLAIVGPLLLGLLSGKWPK